MEQGAKAALLLYSSTGQDPANFGNPSSVHWAGRRVKSVVDDAREKIASAFGIQDPDSLLFTASATEAINTALKGFYFQHHRQGPVRFVSSEVEHEATLESLRFLEELGAEVLLLPVNGDGSLDLLLLNKALDNAPAATLVSLMAANNETGVLFPWEEAAALAKAKGAVFHLDAVQAPGKLPGFSLGKAPVDLASFSAHKIGGPKGVGALYVKRGTKLTSLLHGGAQERKRRAGTTNVAGIASFGAAAESLANRDLAAVEKLRNEMESLVLERISGVSIQGRGVPRIVNTSNFLFDNVRGEALLMGMDLEGFAVSSGSACNSGSILPSHVLLAMGFDKLAAASALRVSLAPSNTKEEILAFVDALERVVDRIRMRVSAAPAESLSRS
jgi:cysteine desulfurase